MFFFLFLSAYRFQREAPYLSNRVRFTRLPVPSRAQSSASWSDCQQNTISVIVSVSISVCACVWTVLCLSYCTAQFMTGQPRSTSNSSGQTTPFTRCIIHFHHFPGPCVTDQTDSERNHTEERPAYILALTPASRGKDPSEFSLQRRRSGADSTTTLESQLRTNCKRTTNGTS